MKTAGVICEYNPFHLGHARHLKQIRNILGDDTVIVCAMSGNYVQRGLPAMWDKYTRANAAVACGADLVLELPITKVLQSAEGFAQSGVELLSRLGCIDVLSFGAECPDENTLMALAQKLDTPACNAALRQHLDRGLPYATARQLAVGDTEGILSSPNNILGIEYCRAIQRYGSQMTPLVIHRTGNYHALTPDANEPSATAVRALFPDGNWMDYIPPEAVSHLDTTYYELRFGERAMLARLRALSDEQWAHCAHGSEGLWSKVMKASRSEATIEDILTKSKSKRYPRTRLQRLILCAYLGISQQDLQQPISYVRILAASSAGCSMLRKIKDAGTLPLINPGEHPANKEYYRLETCAADLFTLFGASDPAPCATEQNARIRL